MKRALTRIFSDICKKPSLSGLQIDASIIHKIR